MKLKKRTYKFLKMKEYFKANEFFLIFNGNLNTKSWFSIQQILHKLNLNSYKIFNNITLKAIENSIYQNFRPLINGSVCLVTTANLKSDIKMKNVTKIDPSMVVLCLKLNNKMYSTSQIEKMNHLNFEKSVFTFHKTLKVNLKTPLHKLKFISK